jgi:hypothetical protein
MVRWLSNPDKRCLNISISPDYPSSRVIQVLGIDFVDRFDHITIVARWKPGCSMAESWSSEESWYGGEVRHQIALAGGPLAFGWLGDPEAF